MPEPSPREWPFTFVDRHCFRVELIKNAALGAAFFLPGRSDRESADLRLLVMVDEAQWSPKIPSSR